MRIACSIFVITWSLVLVGCGGGGAPSPEPAMTGTKPPGNGSSEVIVTPSESTSGKVKRVNAQKRYVVVSFPIGSLPAVDQKMNVYRGGLKVGEINVTGPHLENNTVADIVSGPVRVGDEVREN